MQITSENAESPDFVGRVEGIDLRRPLSAAEVAGIEAGLHTVLVLSGISDRAEIERYPFRPDEVLESVADLLDPRPA